MEASKRTKRASDGAVVQEPSAGPARKPVSSWRGKTYVYLNKEGKRYAVFHRSESGMESWQHDIDPYKKCTPPTCKVDGRPGVGYVEYPDDRKVVK